GLVGPEVAHVASDQRLPRVARDLAISAVHVEDLERVGVDDANRVGGLVDDAPEARVGVGGLGALHDVVEEPRDEPDADDEERDECDRDGPRVDVDAIGDLDARGHEHHRKPAEDGAVQQRAAAAVPRPRLEPLIGVRVEQHAEDQDAGDFDDVVWVDGYSTSRTISISTGMPIGSSAIPTAERACLPIASPKTSTMR